MGRTGINACAPLIGINRPVPVPLSRELATRSDYDVMDIIAYKVTTDGGTGVSELFVAADEYLRMRYRWA
jgi:hypothetical protein